MALTENELSLKKWECRMKALEMAQHNTLGNKSILEFAQEIYEWLIKDLK